MEICSDDNRTTYDKTIHVRKKKKESRTFLASGPCRYPIVRKAAIDQGWKPIYAENSDKARKKCNLLWVDTSNIHDFFFHIKPWQCINHFPGMIDIARKTRLAQHLESMRKKFPKDYAFYPSTFVLPRDLSTLKPYFASKNNKSRRTFIVKPDGGCQGRGIFLTKSWSDLESLNTVHVVQTYITNPLLIENKKFDLRLYVLITSCEPLRIYLYDDGLVRFCTEEFQKPDSKNLNAKCMHLTNYAINKYNENFEQTDGNYDICDEKYNESTSNLGSKRSVKWFLSWVSKNRGRHVADKLWDKIRQICVKTILSVAPTLVREYNSTFSPSKPFCAPETMDSQRNRNESIHKQEGKMIFSGDPLENCPTLLSEENKNNNQIHSICGSRCFAILGFDVMINSKLKPFLIEVNHLPSFATDSKLDEDIKYGVVKQALAIVNAKASDKKAFEFIEKNKHKTRFNRFMSTCSKGNNQERMENNALNKSPNEKLEINRCLNTRNQYESTFQTNDITQTAREVITKIYLHHAPEKVNKIGALLKKYKGYEEWLMAKVKEKYLHRPDKENLFHRINKNELPCEEENKNVKEDLTSLKTDNSNGYSYERELETTLRHPSTSADINETSDRDILLCKEEISLLENYDCIYPSSSENYSNFTRFSFEREREQYMRLTCPLPRPIITEDSKKYQNPANMSYNHLARYDQSPYSSTRTDSRSDCWQHDSSFMRQNNYSQTIPSLKIAVPTEKQIAAVERLSKGMSVVTTSGISKKNGRFSLDENETNTTRQRATLIGKIMRKKNEDKFVSTRSQMVLKEVNIELQPIKARKETIQTAVRDRCFVDFSGRTLGGAWQSSFH